MAKNEIDPFQITREDEFRGGLEPTRDSRGIVRVKRKRRGRLVTHGFAEDKMSMAKVKSEIASLWRDGETYKDIADKVSDNYGLEGQNRLTSHAIHYHIKKMLDYWRQKGLERIDERQAIVLARFEQIEALAVEAYFASMEGKKTKNKSKQIERARSKEHAKQMIERDNETRPLLKRKNKTWVEDGELSTELLDITQEKIARSVKREENKSGDPKFLSIIVAINKERGKLLGLYNKQQQFDPDQEAAKLTDEQRQARLTTILSDAQNRRRAIANSMLADPSPLGGFEIEDPKANGNTPPPEVDDPYEDEGWGFDEDELREPTVPEIEWD